MGPSRKQVIATLVAGAAALAIALPFLDIFRIDVFLLFYLPVAMLVVTRVTPALHWVLFAAVVASNLIILLYVERSDSSTAGLGAIFLVGLLTIAVLVASAIAHIWAQWNSQEAKE